MCSLSLPLPPNERVKWTTISFQAKSVSDNFKALEADYERLAEAGKATRQKFEDLQCVQQIKNDLDEVSNWVNEKIALCSTR